MRVVKNYLKNSMIEVRLKSSMILGIHPIRAQNLDREKLIDTFKLTVECLTVPLWYKQQVTFLNSKFD